jgi:hypothetical protein
MDIKTEEENPSTNLNSIENKPTETVKNPSTEDKSEINKSNDSNQFDDKDSYLNREEFSSEHFKLEIKNLPKNFGFGVKNFF